MIADALDALDEQQLRQALRSAQQTIAFKQAVIDKITHENALLKRLKFAAKSEAFNAEQKSLLDETLDTDLAAVAAEIEALQPQAKTSGDKQVPKRQALPAHLPRRDVRHEPDATDCRCGSPMQRIGEDVAEKLDYQPGVFTVERHIRGKWVCRCCETLTQAPVEAHVIDKGLPTTGLLAQVLVAKFLDHLPLYRQEAIFARAGHAIARSTLAQWVGECGVQMQPLVDALAEELLRQRVLHADETPVAMLAPGQGKTHRAYLWSYSSTQFDAPKIVLYDFAAGRGGAHAQAFLDTWKGKLVCDDYAGYKGLFSKGVTEVGCLAHARRKFHDLWVNHHSPLAEEALKHFALLYDLERQARELSVEQRRRLRAVESRPIADKLHEWLLLHRQKATDGTAIAKAIDYSLGRWQALTRFLDDGALPVDNNWIENRIRPIALGRSNWLFAGSLRAGQRAAAVMSLVQSARLNGHDPYCYLKDVLERLPTQPASRIAELLPHNWTPLVPKI